jgi:hypothetical protein
MGNIASHGAWAMAKLASGSRFDQILLIVVLLLFLAIGFYIVGQFK